MTKISDVFEAQLVVQSQVDDAAHDAACAVRDRMMAKLTLKDRLQLKLSCGILERLVER